MKKSIFGFGGHAREILSLIPEKLIVFVDDEYVCTNTNPISTFDHEKYEILIAVSDPKEREKIVKKLPKKTKYFSFVHPTSIIYGNVTLGCGTYIGPYSILTENIVIGNHALLNRQNHIGHDSIIGDFLSMMPGSIISGNCKIGHKLYLGTNSSVREKTYICDDVTIGLNSGVVKNIIEGGTYVGTPTIKIK